MNCIVWMCRVFCDTVSEARDATVAIILVSKTNRKQDKFESVEIKRAVKTIPKIWWLVFRSWHFCCCSLTKRFFSFLLRNTTWNSPLSLAFTNSFTSYMPHGVRFYVTPPEWCYYSLMRVCVCVTKKTIGAANNSITKATLPNAIEQIYLQISAPSFQLITELYTSCHTVAWADWLISSIRVLIYFLKRGARVNQAHTHTALIDDNGLKKTNHQLDVTYSPQNFVFMM